MKKKTSSGITGVLLLLLAAVLAAGCGGGGGGSTGGTSTAYAGKTSQTAITQGNAIALTNAGSNAGQLSAGAGSSGAGPGAPLLRSAARAARAASLAPETASGNCGGTSVSDITNDAATGAISGTTTFTGYCQDGTTENGQTSFTGTLNGATSVLNITVTFTNYAAKDAASDTIINGTAALTGTVVNGAIDNFTMIMNVDTRDNIENMVLKMENVNITIVETLNYTEFTINSGKVYHPDYGYFDLSTPTAIRINAGDADPSSGVLVITGANNSKGKLTYLSNTQSTVEVDETGSGTFIAVDPAVTPPPAAASPKNELVSRSTDSTVTGTAANSEFPAISADGRYVVFVSYAANLAPGATGLKRQIFVHDRQTHQTELVSVGPAGAEGNGDSFAPAVSSDGRYVVFESYATDLVSGDTNLVRDVFIRDRQSQTTGRVSVDAGGVQGNSESFEPVISADGRYVAFTSYADNLTGGVTGNAKTNVYVRDTLTSTNTLVSMTLGGTGGAVGSSLPAISADGSRIAFYSIESNLVAGDANVNIWDIFLWDRNALPKIKLVSVSSTGVAKNQGTESASRIVAPAISADGDIIAFSTTADNLVVGDTNGLQDVFIHQVSTGVTVRASEGTGGVQATGGDSPVGQGERVALSSDGTWVAFTTAATSISAGGSNIVIHNNVTGETSALTADSGTFSGSKGPAISGDGRFVAFMSGLKLDPRFATSSGVFVQDRTIQ